MGWNERFAGDEYLYGTTPADFVARQAWRLAPGARLLSIADGEGRNGTYLASLGLQVTALEPSENARRKAAELAQERGVSMQTIDADLRGYDWPRGNTTPCSPASSSSPTRPFGQRFSTALRPHSNPAVSL
ncbi:SAM-dependent methyltransferase [Thioclava nitratireducens]|uniref:SAM-dependent methyltransferase n=1 Tax=Thioclava nitratireducens TaxID=1915078 RepID=UPI001FCA4E3A|nr:hypothetical protein [Thioclava nitratireducens]